MSVTVQQLTKTYGAQRAVDNLSFSASKGEVLGFLGPNGAGKSTTMKIITGYLPQTEGRVTVCGFDVQDKSMEARARIGYLPEHNPLYRDMFVQEYLHFTGRVHGVRDLTRRIDTMIERTGLGSHRHKLVGALSKGYRQRVGLAQAMLHDPEVLILDEPTSGLDPNQIVEIRALIKALGQEKTVILSTHILREVEAVCDRAVIINKGRLVADSPISELQSRFSPQNRVTVGFDRPVVPADLKKIKGVSSVEALGDNRFLLLSPQGEDVRPAVFAHAVSQNLVLLELHQDVYSVEDVFQQLTK
ncbi:MAG: ATP-binding cassette domain-containing protein [Saprospiraceae bacterium]|nr:ATP-binding cassette domain-containing protein [Saprospiraceae bacterium]